ncbi:hypothetical protein FOA52_003188 [Chlamydomonas sp. UWO 241]|nr:hypothetical protein FOA52_003188 [Chlamydomonas sp. UWO 241]
MAQLIGTLRGLAGVGARTPMLGAASMLQGALFGSSSAGYATGMTKKDAAYMLDARDDPEVDAAIGAYVKEVYAGVKEPASAGDMPLAAKVEKKYAGAQIVAQGVQNIAVPLGYAAKDTAPIKRFVAELNSLATKAGFECAAAEVTKRLAEKALTAETVKAFLDRIQPLCSESYHASLTEALAAAEAETNSSVSMDATSAGYKAFAKKVEAAASKAGIPVKAIMGAKRDDAGQTAYAAWQQSAAVADATTEVEAMKATASAVLDKHLSKTAVAVRKEAAASMAALTRRLDTSKGQAWAAAYQADLKIIEWFDAQVAASPKVGPKVASA